MNNPATLVDAFRIIFMAFGAVSGIGVAGLVCWANVEMIRHCAGSIK